MSAAEVALYSFTSSRENVGGRIYRRLMKSPQIALTSILVSNSIANFLFASYGASLALDISQTSSVNQTLSVVLEIVVVTAALVFIADAVPKIIAAGNPKLVASTTMPLLALLMLIESPVVIPLNALLSRINARRRRPPMTIDSEGLKALSRIAGDAGVIEESEAELLRKIAFIGEKTVKDAMTLRTEITSIRVESCFDEVVESFRTSEHSRLPVYSNSHENIVGMLYARDILPLLNRKRKKKFDVSVMMRKPVFVPETQPIEMLLETFRLNKLHIAVAVDEFGGLSGIVTLSDVVREIFGSSAEMPREKMMPVEIGENMFLVSGGARLDDLSPEVGGFDFEFVSGESISGLLIQKYGAVPRVGNKTTLGSFEFEVAQATPKAILQVKLRQLYSGSVEENG